MRSEFDRRVVPDEVLALIRACQGRVPCLLIGGAALSGAYLAHRLSRDVDLVFRSQGDVRRLARELPAVEAATGAEIVIVQDAGTFVRARCQTGPHVLDLDLVWERIPDLEPPGRELEGVVVASLADLRAAKLTCLLSRSEPRDLVDLLFLDRAGFPPERDLGLALQKDAGMDPGVLGWLLRDFPLEPLPEMLEPLEVETLAAFRDDLRARLRALAVPEDGAAG